MTSNHHAPYDPTHVLQWPVQRAVKPRGGTNPKKPVSVRLQAATRLHEVGIASNRGSACRGEYVPGLVHTARHTTRVYNTRSRWGNRKEPAAEGGIDDWGEVVTR